MSRSVTGNRWMNPGINGTARKSGRRQGSTPQPYRRKAVRVTGSVIYVIESRGTGLLANERLLAKRTWSDGELTIIASSPPPSLGFKDGIFCWMPKKAALACSMHSLEELRPRRIRPKTVATRTRSLHITSITPARQKLMRSGPWPRSEMCVFVMVS